MDNILEQAIKEEEKNITAERITFRVSTKDKKLIVDLMKSLELSQSAIVRVGLRVLAQYSKENSL